MIGGLGLSAKPSEAGETVRARAQFDVWMARVKASDGSAVSEEGLMELIQTLALAERASGSLEQAPIDSLIMLEQIYRIIGSAESLTDNKLFPEMIRNFVEVIARKGDLESSTLLSEVAQIVFGGPKRAGELRLRTIAILLRRAPGHPKIPKIMSQSATSIFDSNESLAVAMAQRSIAMRGEGATVEQWLTLATLCHRSLDLRCGDKALVKAKALVPADDKKLNKRARHVASLGTAAHQAVELKDATALQDSLVRGKAMVELSRYDQAKEIFGHLNGLHPQDARPVAGLVETVLSHGLDLPAAFEILGRAHPQEHLDRSWYELSISVRSMGIFYHVLPNLAEQDPDAVFEMLRPMLDDLHTDIEGFNALGADKGRVLSFLYDLGMEAWPRFRSDKEGSMLGLARGLLARTVALQAEVPNSLHAYTLVLTSAEFSDDRERALAVLDLEPPREHAEALAVRRAQAAIDLVAAWNASDRVETMLRLTDAVDGPKKPTALRRSVIDAHVLAHRLGYDDGDSLAELERRYEALRATASGARDVVLLNNLAVLVADNGRVEEAVGLWSEANDRAKDDEERYLLRLNAFAARFVAGAPGSTFTSEQSAELLALAENEDATVNVRLLAHAWRVAGSKKGDVRGARKALRAAARREAKSNLRPRFLPGKGGVILRAEVEMKLGHSSREGMQLQLDVASTPWLTVPCPVAIPDPPGE